MAARDKNSALMVAASGHGIILNRDDANTLRRAELTLHRWAEEDCNGTIQRPWADTVDGDSRPYRPGNLMGQYCEGLWARIPDRERGALRRVAAVCDRLGLHWYHQEDPRGCALYISGEPLPANNYTRGVACSR
jgi:hypothetical protein